MQVQVTKKPGQRTSGGSSHMCIAALAAASLPSICRSAAASAWLQDTSFCAGMAAAAAAMVVWWLLVRCTWVVVGVGGVFQLLGAA